MVLRPARLEVGHYDKDNLPYDPNTVGNGKVREKYNKPAEAPVTEDSTSDVADDPVEEEVCTYWIHLNLPYTR